MIQKCEQFLLPLLTQFQPLFRKLKLKHVLLSPYNIRNRIIKKENSRRFLKMWFGNGSEIMPSVKDGYTEIML